MAWVVRQVSPVITSHEGQGMDLFRDYRQVFPAHARHRPSGGCVVCCSQPALTRREFADLVGHILGNRYLNGETIRLDGAVRLAPK